MRDLTPRQKEVINLMKEGYSKPKMAELLCLSLPTVCTHTRNILHKLDAVNTANAVYLYYRGNNGNER